MSKKVINKIILDSAEAVSNDVKTAEEYLLAEGVDIEDFISRGLKELNSKNQIEKEEADSSAKKNIKIPELQEQENKHFLKRKILASFIINQSLNDSKFGDVKFEKLLHLTDYCAIQRNLGQKYLQKAAGPYDNSFTYPYFQQVLKAKWFTKEKMGSLNRIKADVNQAKSVNTYDFFSKEELTKIKTIIAHFSNSSYERPEIVSTLYAVWNNRIIKNQTITDDLLKEDFLNWDQQKIKYKNRLDDALNWMRENGFVPNGWGKVIEKAKGNKK